MTMMPQIIQFQPRPANVALHRARLLARAARAGLSGYDRQRDLPRLLRSAELPALGAILPRLRAEEQDLNQARLDARAEYDLQRHVLLLIAILAEITLAAPSPVTLIGTAIQARP